MTSAVPVWVTAQRLMGLSKVQAGHESASRASLRPHSVDADQREIGCSRQLWANDSTGER